MEMRAVRGYIVMKCKECGTLNIIHKNQINETIYSDEVEYVITNAVCADCEGKLEYIGRALLQDKPSSSISVSVDVEREPFDRLLEDIAMLHQEVDGITEKMNAIRGAAGNDGTSI